MLKLGFLGGEGWNTILERGCKMAKYLVTGAAGFIGSNLVEYLLNKVKTVIGLDNLSTWSLENLNLEQGLIKTIEWYKEKA